MTRKKTMKWKEFAEDYLNFNRKDRIGITVILGVILSAFFLPKAFSKGKTLPKVNSSDTAWIASMMKLEQKETEGQDAPGKFADENSSYYQYDRSISNDYGKTIVKLFYFDPNTLSPEGWQRLGLRDKTIKTIQNYLSKGGRFKNPEDVQKIYGLFPDEYKRIVPYIRIETDLHTKNTQDYAYNESPKESYPSKKYTPPHYTVIDINETDTTALIALPGIGSKLAARIVNFRDKLGGFYSVSQVGETFGLPDSTFQKIKQYLKVENTTIRKININTATLDELKAHPYIKWGIANPIVAYRKEHGPFSRVEDIKKVMAVTDEIYNKISPYLVIQ